MKKTYLIGIAAVAVLVVLGIGYYLLGDAALEVDTYTVDASQVVKTVEETALVLSRSQQIIQAKAMGEVTDITVQPGNAVNQGEIVLALDTQETDLQLKSFAARLEGLEATRAEYSANIAANIEVAEANLRSAQIQKEEASRNLERSSTLYESGAISLQQYQQAQDYYNLQIEAVGIATQQLNSLVEDARNKKQQLAAQIDDMQYQISILQTQRLNMIVKAPYDGLVLDVFVEQGEVVQLSSPLLEIGKKDDIYLEANLLVSEVGAVAEGAEVLLSHEELDVASIRGVVEKVYPKAVTSMSDLGVEQRRVKVDIGLLTQPQELKVGYELDVSIITSKELDVIRIPDNAVFDEQGTTFVFVIVEGTAQKREVKTGLEGENFIEITSGLEVGEIVIVSPDGDIQDGVKVRSSE